MEKWSRLLILADAELNQQDKKDRSDSVDDGKP